MSTLYHIFLEHLNPFSRDYTLYSSGTELICHEKHLRHFLNGWVVAGWDKNFRFRFTKEFSATAL